MNIKPAERAERSEAPASNGKEIMEKKVRYTIFTTTFYLCHDGGDSTPFGRKNFSWGIGDDRIGPPPVLTYPKNLDG